jgi:nicotinamidase/pyrazinamidase
VRALLIVDVQYDFLPGGALPVPEGHLVIPAINSILDRFPLVVATQDWHPANHGSFASNHPGRSPFETGELNGLPQVFWPDHCVQGSQGARISEEIPQGRIQMILRKGTDPTVDSYSAFFDNRRARPTGLCGYLKERGVRQVWIAGLAGDYCAYYSAVDASDLGFQVVFLEDATRPISPQGFLKAKEDMARRGIRIANAGQLTWEE